MRGLLRLFPMRPVRCPCCRLRIDGQHVWDYRNCAACGAKFTIRRQYLGTTYLLALTISGGIAFAVGNRDTALLSLALLLLVPTFWAMVMISIRLFPLDITVVREGWTPGESEEDQEIARVFESVREADLVLARAEPEHPEADLAESNDDAPGRLPLSTPVTPPVSLEGIVIALMFAGLLAWHLYTALEPHFHSGRTSTESASPPAR